MVANKTKCSEPTICLRNICKDVTLIPLYLINYSISANISILTWMQLISIIDCIGIWKTRFHSSNNTKELVLKVRCAVKVHRAGTCFIIWSNHFHRSRFQLGNDKRPWKGLSDSVIRLDFVNETIFRAQLVVR